MKERLRTGLLPLAALLTLAAVLRVALTCEHYDDPLFSFYRIDEHLYRRWAKAVMGGVFFLDYVPNHAPGYPWLLGIFYFLLGDHPLVPRILQIGLGLGSTLVVHRIGTRLMEPRAALAAALLFGLYWPFMIFEQRLLATSLFLFLSLASLLAALRATDHDSMPAWALTGVLTGAAVIVRPTALLWLLGALGWLGVRALLSKNLSLLGKAVGLAATASLVIVPVVWKNHAIEGQRFLIQRKGALNLYLGNNPASDGTPYARLGATWDAVEALPVKEEGITNEAEQQAFYLGEVLDFLKRDPGGFLLLQLKKGALLANGREIRATLDPEFHRKLFRTLSLPLPGFGLVLGLALAGGLAVRRSRSAHQLWLLYLAAYAAAVLSGPIASRYRAPLTGALMVFSGAGLIRLLDSLRNVLRERVSRSGGWRPREFLPWVLLAVGLLVAALPVAPDHSDAEEWTYRGDAWFYQGNREEALACYERALAQDPGYSIALIRLAKLERLAGRLDDSLGLLERAVASDPNHSQVYYELGITLWEAGEREQAVQQLTLAVEKRPQWVRALKQLAQWEWEIGAKEKAREHVRTILSLLPHFEEAKRMLLEMEEGSTSESHEAPRRR